MSRCYKLDVRFKGISLEEVKKIVCEKFGWAEGSSYEETKKDAGYLECDGSLYGGMSEKEAHDQIYSELKKIKRDCKVKTIFTYLEELPYEEYGDEL